MPPHPRAAHRRLPISSRTNHLALLVGLVIAGTLSPALPFAGSSAVAAGSPITYSYDSGGRITGVIDPAQPSAATYSYDQAGNISSIAHRSTTAVSILGFQPVKGPAGTSVTITGTDFSSTAASDTVTFNGVTATISSASLTRLVVSVPAGATTGPVHVTTPAGSATSSTSFVVGSTPVPTVSTLSVGVATAGSTITLNGTGFNSNPTFDVVRVSGTIARVQSATATSIVAVVPPNTGSGPVTVTTPGGTGTSKSDLFVPAQSPVPYQASQVQSTGTIGFGQTQNVTIGSSGGLGMLAFVGAAGGVGTVNVGSGMNGCFSIYVFDSDNRQIASNFFCGSGGILDRFTLAIGGTYTIVLDSGTSTGTVPVTLNKIVDVRAAIVPNGAAVPVNIAQPGQNGYLTFHGTAGNRASFSLSGPSGFYVEAALLDPLNQTVVGPEQVNGGSAFVDTVTLRHTGTYTFALEHSGTFTGATSVSLHLFSDKHATITPNAAAQTVSLDFPGQDALLTFAGTGGQKASVELSNSTMSSYSVQVLDPNGQSLAYAGAGDPSLTGIRLHQSGTYTVAIRHNAGQSVGSVDLAVAMFADIHGAIVPNGAAVNVDVANPGQDAYYTFSGTSGTTATVNFTNSTFNSGSNANFYASILNPDGSVLAGPDAMYAGDGFIVGALPSTGTYTLFIQHNNNYVGTVTAQLGVNSGYAPALVRHPLVTHPTTARGPHAAGGHHQNWPPRKKKGFGVLMGRVMNTNGRPLQHVMLTIGRYCVETHAWGDFTFKHAPAGDQVLTVHGATANTRKATYGVFEIHVSVKRKAALTLPYVIWLPKLDTTHEVTIPSPAPHKIVLTNPRIPGLKIILPKGAVVRDMAGHVVHRLGITPIPTARPPFPFPTGNPFPVYFTVQPGGAVVTPAKVRVIYPNVVHDPPGMRMNFWSYEPDEGGWWIYGHGHVTKDGKSIVPDHGVYFYEFTGAGAPDDGGPPRFGPANSGCGPDAGGGGDGGGGGGGGGSGPAGGGDNGAGSCPVGGQSGAPVDLATGLLLQKDTDLYLPDIIPIDITRVYRPDDSHYRYFGYGSNFPYGMWLYHSYTGPNGAFRQVNLVLDNGGQIVFNQLDTGVFRAAAQPGMFSDALLTWNGKGWDIKLTNGWVYSFSDFGAANVNAVLLAVRDPHGDTMRLTYDSNHYLQAIKSPNGRWVQFAYNGAYTIQSIVDDAGRTISYTYQNNDLTSVTDADGNITTYTYDGNGNLTSIVDPRGNTTDTIAYDSSGRVTSETLADGTTWTYVYSVNGFGQIVQTRVTDPNGNVEDAYVNSRGDMTDAYYADGSALAQHYSMTFQPNSDLLTGITDALNRTTAVTYDTRGNVNSFTKLAGTAQAQTYLYTFDPTFSQPASVTDPLNYTKTYSYDAFGDLTSAIDRNGNKTTATYNSQGEITSVTDPMGHTTHLAYTFGDLASVTDPLGRTSKRFVDAGGRVLSITDPLGNTTTHTYDAMGRLTKVTDPLGDTTTTAYDADGNRIAVTDPRGNTTYYTYNARNQLCAVTQALAGLSAGPQTCPTAATAHTTVNKYDGIGNLIQRIDRRGDATVYQYDALNRLTKITYAGGSTSTFTWDAGNRMTRAVDSVSGTITNTFDNLDRLTGETTPQGSVAYTYDAAGRRLSMQATDASGTEPLISYSWDNGGRLDAITQGTGTVSCNGQMVTVCLSYNADDQRASVQNPGGLTQTYSYDQGNQLTGTTYTAGSTNLGDLTYGYDLNGRQITLGGTWARTGIPPAVATATYNADNELTKWGSATLTYDANGNLAADGTNSYAWNTRNQLASLGPTGSPPSTTFSYDAFGRRVSRVSGGTMTKYLLDGGNISEQLNSSGAPTAKLLDGPNLNQYFTFGTGSGQSSILTDGLGSTLALADGTGTLQTQYTYDPYGSTTSSGPVSSNPIQYAGMQNDGTGQYFDHARYYVPSAGRFTAQDPLGCRADEANLYRYVAGDPLDQTDSTGDINSCAGDALATGGLLLASGPLISLGPIGFGVIAANLSNFWNALNQPTSKCKDVHVKVTVESSN